MSVHQPHTEPSLGANDKHIMKDTQYQNPEYGTGIVEDQRVDATRQGAFGTAAAAGGKQYRVLGRWKTAFVFIHTEVGIGILSLPSVLSKLGLIPGLIAILGIGLVTTYTAYVYLLYWRRHPHIDNLPDALRCLGGKPLATIGAIGLIINLSLACASSLLTMSVALNTLTGHSMCTVAFIGFAALVCYVLCMPRSMNFVAYFSGMPSSCAAIFSVTFANFLRPGYSGYNYPHLHRHHIIGERQASKSTRDLRLRYQTFRQSILS